MLKHSRISLVDKTNWTNPLPADLPKYFALCSLLFTSFHCSHIQRKGLRHAALARQKSLRQKGAVHLKKNQIASQTLRARGVAVTEIWYEIVIPCCLTSAGLSDNPLTVILLDSDNATSYLETNYELREHISSMWTPLGCTSSSTRNTSPHWCTQQCLHRENVSWYMMDRVYGQTACAVGLALLWRQSIVKELYLKPRRLKNLAPFHYSDAHSTLSAFSADCLKHLSNKGFILHADSDPRIASFTINLLQMKLRTILLQEIREGWFLVVPVPAVDQLVYFKNHQSSWAWWLSTWENCSRKFQCTQCMWCDSWSNMDECIGWLCGEAPIPVRWFLHNDDCNLLNPIVQRGLERAVVQSQEYPVMVIVIASNHTVAGKSSGDIPAIPETCCDRILTVSEVARAHQPWLKWK